MTRSRPPSPPCRCRSSCASCSGPAPEPAGNRAVWLVIQTGPDAGSAIELPADGKVVLGRQRGCEVIVRDARASRRHAELEASGGKLVLRDLGSANGTYLDGTKVALAELHGGEDV